MSHPLESSLPVVIVYAAGLLSVIAAWVFARRPEKPAIARNLPVNTHPGAALCAGAVRPSSRRLKERVRFENFGPITDW